VTKTATLLGVSKGTVSNVMSAYTNHGKTSAKRKSGRNYTLTERDRRRSRRIVSKNHTTTAAQVTGQQN
jgi:transposase